MLLLNLFVTDKLGEVAQLAIADQLPLGSFQRTHEISQLIRMSKIDFRQLA